MPKDAPSPPADPETTLCAVCLMDEDVETPARLVRKGQETDQYVCEKGHAFSLDHEVER